MTEFGCVAHPAQSQPPSDEPPSATARARTHDLARPLRCRKSYHIQQSTSPARRGIYGGTCRGNLKRAPLLANPFVRLCTIAIGIAGVGLRIHDVASPLSETELPSAVLLSVVSHLSSLAFLFALGICCALPCDTGFWHFKRMPAPTLLAIHGASLAVGMVWGNSSMEASSCFASLAEPQSKKGRACGMSENHHRRASPHSGDTLLGRNILLRTNRKVHSGDRWLRLLLLHWHTVLSCSKWMCVCVCVCVLCARALELNGRLES